MEAQNRVVVTGMGVVAPNGIGLDAFWESLLTCKSGIGPITQFDAEGLKCRIAGEVYDFNLADYIDPHCGKRMSRASHLAIAAAKMAFEDAKIDPQKLMYLPVVMGVSTTAMDLRALPPHSWSIVSGIPHAVGSAVAYTLGFSAKLNTIANGCAAGLDAIAEAAALIQKGGEDIALAGASDSSIVRYAFECFVKSRKVSFRNDEPAKASRPFDKDRDGGVASEGACVVVLENLEHALARGAQPYAEFVGYATNADLPGSEEGSGMAESMQNALYNACMIPEQIDAISAHAPSDEHMDRIETALIKQVFGEHAYHIPVFSIKGVIGNPMSVGCAFQIVSSALALSHQIVPPTANLDEADSFCDLDYVPKIPRVQKLDTVLVNAHCFGRGNSSLILRKVNT